MKKSLFLLLLITLTGGILRFYKLGEAPAGLYLDEAGQGYSAYSILKTGKDEFGKAFPIVFRSFVDFKTPVYIYLVVPLIPIFGLSSFTVRFPSFFFSVLTFPVFYLLIEKLTEVSKLKNFNLIKNLKFKISIIATLLLAISPWHILFGRTNFEANLALFFMLAGLLAFYSSLKFPKLLILSSLLFALAIPAYHSQRIITPLLLLILGIRFRKTLFAKSHQKSTLIAIILGALISLPTLSIMATPGFLARAGGLNIFSHARQMPAGFSSLCQGPACIATNNSIFLSIQEFGSLYLSYFSPRNMFILGDSGPRSSFPHLSTFFLWQFPFYIYGLYILIKNKKLAELRFITLVLLLVSPLPAALTRDPYSTIRSLPLVIPQITIITLGMLVFFSWFIHLKLKHLTLIKNLKFKMSYLLSLLLLIYSLLKLHSSIIILNEHYRAPWWNYGWQQVVEAIKTQANPSLPIVVDNARNEPYIQLLFFLKFDPARYQQENFEVSLSEYYTNMERVKQKKIGRITTRAINWKPDLQTEQYLIGDQLAISPQQIKEHNLTLIEEIFYPDGSPAFRIVKTNPN